MKIVPVILVAILELANDLAKDFFKRLYARGVLPVFEADFEGDEKYEIERIIRRKRNSKYLIK